MCGEGETHVHSAPPASRAAVLQPAARRAPLNDPHNSSQADRSKSSFVFCLSTFLKNNHPCSGIFHHARQMAYVNAVRMRAVGTHFKLTDEELNMPGRDVLQKILKAVVFHKYNSEIEQPSDEGGEGGEDRVIHRVSRTSIFCLLINSFFYLAFNF